MDNELTVRPAAAEEVRRPVGTPPEPAGAKPRETKNDPSTPVSPGSHLARLSAAGSSPQALVGPRNPLPLAVLLLIVTLAFYQSPGTIDVPVFWLPWMDAVQKNGWVNGYASVESDYPPLCSLYLLAAYRVGSLFGQSDLLCVKLSITAFLLLTSAVFWFWTRDTLLTAVLHLGLVINSVALGYLDVYVAPALLAALWALKQKRYVAFTALYSTACLAKWQPAILAPFLVLYVWRTEGFKTTALRIALPGLLILGVVYSVFGTSLLSSLEKALTHGFLSALALNFDWIVTHALHVYYPAYYGGLEDGESGLLVLGGGQVFRASKVLFWTIYSAVVLLFLCRRPTFENLVFGSLLGYLAYFTFNTGVHENHLFPAGLLAAVLCWLNREHLYRMFVILLMMNLNLFLFYGFSGSGPGFSRVALIDVALAASCFNVLYFLALYWGFAVREGATPVRRGVVAALPVAVTLLVLAALPLLVYLGGTQTGRGKKTALTPRPAPAGSPEIRRDSGKPGWYSGPV